MLININASDRSHKIMVKKALHMRAQPFVRKTKHTTDTQTSLQTFHFDEKRLHGDFVDRVILAAAQPHPRRHRYRQRLSTQ